MTGPPLRIALVHSYYDERRPSGENLVVDGQVEVLRRAGHEVALYSLRTSQTQHEPLFEIRAAARTATGLGRSPADLQTFGPDIVHIHNLFPNFGRRWVEDLQAPMVTTLHNYRPVCAQPMLFRDGAVCTLCPDGRPWSSFRYACYRDDRFRTLPLTLSMLGGPMTDPVLAEARRILVMNETMSEVYAAAGVPRDRLIVTPNFLPDDLDPGQLREEDREDVWLYVGRLGREKGILRLVESWPSGHRLRIVGAGGEDEVDVRQRACGNIEMLGALPRDEVLGLMRSCAGLIFPSIWFEGSPLVYAEALACGLPVVAFEPTSLATTVQRDRTGLRARWPDDLGATLAGARRAFPGLRRRCRDVFEMRYSEGAFLERTVGLYRDVIETS